MAENKRLWQNMGQAIGRSRTIKCSMPAREEAVRDKKRCRRLCVVGLCMLGVVTLPACTLPFRTTFPDKEPQSQLATRTKESRVYTTRNRLRVMRAVVSTLQDLEFVVDSADDSLGVITATKLDGAKLRITVTVRPWGKERTLVRANARLNAGPLTNATGYRLFFSRLSKTLALDAELMGTT